MLASGSERDRPAPSNDCPVRYRPPEGRPTPLRARGAPSPTGGRPPLRLLGGDLPWRLALHRGRRARYRSVSTELSTCEHGGGHPVSPATRSARVSAPYLKPVTPCYTRSARLTRALAPLLLRSSSGALMSQNPPRLKRHFARWVRRPDRVSRIPSELLRLVHHQMRVACETEGRDGRPAALSGDPERAERRCVDRAERAAHGTPADLMHVTLPLVTPRVGEARRTPCGGVEGAG